MKKCLMMVMAVSVSGFFLAGIADARDKVELVSNDYPPFYCEKPIENKGNGFVADLVVAAFDAADIDAVLSYQPVLRSVQSLKEGKFVAYVGSKLVLLSEIREDEVTSFHFCKYHLLFNYFKSHLPQEPTYAELSDLKAYRIGDIVGTQRGFDKAGLTVELTPTLEQGMKKLEAKRLDLWVAAGVTAYFMVRTHFPERLSDLAVVRKPLGSGSIDINFLKAHKDAEKMAALYEKGLKTIRENGKCAEILKRYVGDGMGGGLELEDSLPSCQ